MRSRPTEPPRPPLGAARRPGRRARLNALVLAAVLAAAAAGGCSDGASPGDAARELCGGESGLGLRVTGRAVPVDLCLPDDDVVNQVEEGVRVTLTPEDRYDVRAVVTGPDGTRFDVQFLFDHRDSLPAVYGLTTDFAQALADPDLAWMRYGETPPVGQAVESGAITRGTLVLVFSDRSVATATITDVGVDLVDVGGGNPAGRRVVTQGFLSISTD